MPKKPQNIGICAGSFDPITNGHINIIQRGLKIFDHIYVAVAVNTQKQYLFSVEERLEMIKEVFKNEDRVTVDAFEGLLVSYVKAKKASAILRGLRTVQDFESEFQISLANKHLDASVNTIFMMTEDVYSHLSSSIIKEIIGFGGSGRGMVPPIVEKKLREKLAR